jgi:hypothetical protein
MALVSALACSEVRNLAVTSADFLIALLPERALRIRNVSSLSDDILFAANRSVVAFAGPWRGHDAFVVSTDLSNRSINQIVLALLTFYAACSCFVSQDHLNHLPGIGAPVFFGPGSRLALPESSVVLESLTLVEKPPATAAKEASPLPQFEEIVANVKYLEVLVIQGCVASGDIGILTCLSATLRHLNIEGCSGISGEPHFIYLIGLALPLHSSIVLFKDAFFFRNASLTIIFVREDPADNEVALSFQRKISVISMYIFFFQTITFRRPLFARGPADARKTHAR